MLRPSVPRIQIRSLLQLRHQVVSKEDGLRATCIITRSKNGFNLQRQQQQRSLAYSNDHHGPFKSPPLPSMALFQQQMKELQMEQNDISGIRPSEAALVPEQQQPQQQQQQHDDDHPEQLQQHQLFQEQMIQLQDERQELFGFTHEEHSAWSNAGTNHNHSANWMKALQDVRQQQQQNQQQQEHHNSSISLEDDVDDQLTEFSSSTSSSSISLFTHVSQDGASVQMVDVGMKQVTRRVAVAQSKVIFPPDVMQALQVANDLVGPKGPILATAKLAGIMAAKRTSDLIPLCHPLPLEQVHVDITLQGNVALITCECRVTHKTGVEMEALTGATIAALTIYDMVKAVSHHVRIEETRLVSKTGGKRNVAISETSSNDRGGQ